MSANRYSGSVTHAAAAWLALSSPRQALPESSVSSSEPQTRNIEEFSRKTGSADRGEWSLAKEGSDTCYCIHRGNTFKLPPPISQVETA